MNSLKPCMPVATCNQMDQVNTTMHSQPSWHASLVVTVLANTLDAQGVLLQVVEILWELHLEIVGTRVRKRPACTPNTRATESCPRFWCRKGCQKATKQCGHACAGCKHKRAFFTATKHNETTQTCQKSNIYTIAMMV